jgi:CubicO group peptidase (beta-lactamase class C family)
VPQQPNTTPSLLLHTHTPADVGGPRPPANQAPRRSSTTTWSRCSASTTGAGAWVQRTTRSTSKALLFCVTMWPANYLCASCACVASSMVWKGDESHKMGRGLMRCALGLARWGLHNLKDNLPVSPFYKRTALSVKSFKLMRSQPQSAAGFAVNRVCL